MIRRIVVGVDGSDASMDAARMAAEIAEKFEARLLLAYVVPPVVVPADSGGAELGVVEAHRRAGEDALARTRQALLKPGLTIESRVGYGAIAETLTDLATAQDADLVVVGSRGRGAVARVLLGSVATRLGHICRRPVLIVHGASAPQPGGTTP